MGVSTHRRARKPAQGTLSQGADPGQGGGSDSLHAQKIGGPAIGSVGGAVLEDPPGEGGADAGKAS